MRIIMVYPFIIGLIEAMLIYSLQYIFTLQMLYFRILYFTRIIHYFIQTAHLIRAQLNQLLIHI
jgi:hypothetical protein